MNSPVHSAFTGMRSPDWSTPQGAVSGEKFGCHWLLDKVLIKTSLNKNLSKEEFQVWTLNREVTLTRKELDFTLSCTDGNARVLFSKSIEYSVLPPGK